MDSGEFLFPDADSIREACARREPEALALEFKEKADPGNPILAKDDRKNIAKSVSAMANGSGGTLVFGVRTSKLEGADCAETVMPIKDIAAFARQFESAVYSCISPELKTWRIKVLEDSQSPGDGFLICEVSTSQDRPHMSIASGEHTYYRRTFQGDQPMTPLEVKDQILAVKEARLRVRIRRGGGAFSWVEEWLAVKTELSFLIENAGSTMCKNPFLRVGAEPPLESYGSRDPLTLRYKTDFEPGKLLHIGDVLPSLTLSFCARIFKDSLRFGLQQNDKKISMDSIKLYDGNDEIHSRTIGDKEEIRGFTLNFVFGAENAGTRVVETHLGSEELKCLVFHASKSSLIENWGRRSVLGWTQERELEFFGPDDYELQFD